MFSVDHIENLFMLTNLFPSIKANFATYLDVSPLHSLYVREYGNPKGIPVIVLHGGPGAGCNDDDARYFDPDFYRIILLDQRGAGKSKPFGMLKNNTTPDLVEDLEKVRNYFNIDKWLVFGGSWGSSLALLYGEHYPEHCLGFILRGIWLGGICEFENILWSLRDFFPKEWKAMEQLLPKNQQKDFCKNFCNLVLSDDQETSTKAIQAFMFCDLKASFLKLNSSNLKKMMADNVLIRGVARIFCHYFLNQFFLTHNQILKHLDQITHLPCYIVNGRYDVITRPQVAYTLHEAWRNSKLKIVEKAGHSKLEPGIASALIEATEAIKKITL